MQIKDLNIGQTVFVVNMQYYNPMVNDKIEIQECEVVEIKPYSIKVMDVITNKQLHIPSEQCVCTEDYWAAKKQAVNFYESQIKRIKNILEGLENHLNEYK